MLYSVWCRDDTSPDGTKGAYVRATRQVFLTEIEARTYMAGISPSREPLLRHGAPLGKLVATPGAVAAFSREFLADCLARHSVGDWGDVGGEDSDSNDRSTELFQGGMILSSYKSESGVELWIITEWDRSVTTFLLPGEY